MVNVRLVKEPPLYSHKAVTCAEDVLSVVAKELKDYDREVFAIINLKTNGKPINILDESTSNLDFGTENVIFDTIYNKLPDSTMLIAAHRLSTIKNCDRIIVLDDGKVIEEGNHDELLVKKGRYYSLWQLQQGNLFTANNGMDMQEQSDDSNVYIDESGDTIVNNGEQNGED